MNLNELEEDQRTDNETQKEEYWQKRCYDAFRWCCALTASNFFFQTLTIIKPKTDAQLTMHIIYMAGTLICIALMIYTTKKKKFFKKITFGICAYLVFRNSILLLDFEQIKDTFDPIEGWYFKVATQFYGCATTTFMMYSCFEIGFFQNITVYLLLIWVYFCLFGGIYENLADAFK